MSTVEPTTSEASERKAVVSHLLSAEEMLHPGWCVRRFCPECVREACQWSAEP